MAKRKKRRLSKPPPETYQVEINDWNVRHTFLGLAGQGINGPEDSCLVLHGKLVSPEYKEVSKTQICLWADGNWDKVPAGKTLLTIGTMQVLRDKITLDMTCSIPPHLFSRIQVPLAAKKFKYMGRRYGGSGRSCTTSCWIEELRMIRSLGHPCRAPSALSSR